MSQILVIEPNRMLQQAIALSLFPEHETRSVLSLSDVDAESDFDLLIVDAASLRELEAIDLSQLDTFRRSKIPVIWIEDAAAASSAALQQVIVMRRPLKKTDLHAAVKASLESSTATRPRLRKEKPAASAAEEAVKQPSPYTVSADTESNLIELVDVVEEGVESMADNLKEKK